MLVRRGSPSSLANAFLIHRRKQVLLVFEDVLQQLQDAPTRWTRLRDDPKEAVEPELFSMALGGVRCPDTERRS